jgi:hypothetical protein
MAITNYISLINGSVGSGGPIVTVTGDAVATLNNVIPATTTATLPFATGPTGTISGIFLNVEGAPINVRSNTWDGTGGQVLAFATSIPLVWATSMPVACPITTAATQLVCVNTSTTTVTISGFCSNNV